MPVFGSFYENQLALNFKTKDGLFYFVLMEFS